LFIRNSGIQEIGCGQGCGMMRRFVIGEMPATQ
jgi:hypothetical protein